MNRTRRYVAVLAGVLVTLVCGAAPAFAMIPVPDGDGTGSLPPQPAVIRTVVVGGMPGWQIALIAVGSALVAVMAAVAAEHTWRRRGAVAPS